MATAAAGLIARARRRIASHFMAANAVAPADAVAFEPGRRIEQRQFDRMVDAGVIVDAGAGKFWMNLPQYDQWQRDRRKKAGMAIAVLAVIGGAFAAIVA